MKEKDVLGLTESLAATPQSTLITVHRSRIVEVTILKCLFLILTLYTMTKF